MRTLAEIERYIFAPAEQVLNFRATDEVRLSLATIRFTKSGTQHTFVAPVSPAMYGTKTELDLQVPNGLYSPDNRYIYIVNKVRSAINCPTGLNDSATLTLKNTRLAVIYGEDGSSNQQIMLNIPFVYNRTPLIGSRIAFSNGSYTARIAPRNPDNDSWITLPRFCVFGIHSGQEKVYLASLSASMTDTNSGYSALDTIFYGVKIECLNTMIFSEISKVIAGRGIAQGAWQ